MELKEFILKTVKECINENVNDYSKWKRKNVTMRGIKEMGADNGVVGSFGKGLYSVPLSNKSMAKEYGELYFIVNAIPQNPKIVNSLNEAEILRQNIIQDFCKKNNQDYSLKFFYENTTMEKEMINLGYDGLIIKGREMVHYKPKDVKYFKTEQKLKNYFDSI